MMNFEEAIKVLKDKHKHIRRRGDDSYYEIWVRHMSHEPYHYIAYVTPLGSIKAQFDHSDIFASDWEIK